jgi:hypothetical protein
LKGGDGVKAAGTAQRVDMYFSAGLPEAHRYLQELVRDNQEGVEDLRKKAKNSKLYFIVAAGSMAFNVILMAALWLIS